MKKVPERTMETVLIRKVSDVTIQNGVFQYQIKEADNKCYADCEWYPIMSGKSNLLGYYYKVKQRVLEVEENVALDLRIQVNESEPFEFYYSHHRNIFAQKSKDAQGNETTKKRCTVGSDKISEYKEIREEKLKDDQSLCEVHLPNFYLQLLPSLERISAITGDNYLLSKIIKKQNYGQDVVLYRISGSTCLKVKDENNNIQILNSIETENSSERKITNENNKVGEKVVRNSIKNRKNLERTLESLPSPSEFWKLLVLCVIIFVVSTGISLSEFLLYQSLFSEEKDIDNLLYYQTEQFRCLCQSASIILQAVSVNEYIYSHFL